MNNMWLRHRQIEYFDPATEELIGTIDLPGFDLQAVKRHFETGPEDHLMFGSYPIDSSRAGVFPEVDFDFNRYDYFLSCSSDYSVRTNQIMDQYLQRLEYDYGDRRVDLPPELEELAGRDFLVEHGCLMFKDPRRESHPSCRSDLDKCDLEYSETHVHVDGYADCEAELDYLWLGLEYGKRIARRLAEGFPDDRFRVMVSFSETRKVDGVVETCGSCAIRFYKIRPGAEKQMYVKDLDRYKQEAVLEFERR